MPYNSHEKFYIKNLDKQLPFVIAFHYPQKGSSIVCILTSQKDITVSNICRIFSKK